MNAHHEEGLGLSVLVYLAAMLGGLAAFVVPVYLANGPTVLQSPDARIQANRIFNARRYDRHFPVARLEHEAIVDPATLAELSAKAKESKPARSARIHTPRRTHRHRAQPRRNSYAELRRQHRPTYPLNPAMF